MATLILVIILIFATRGIWHAAKKEDVSAFEGVSLALLLTISVMALFAESPQFQEQEVDTAQTQLAQQHNEDLEPKSKLLIDVPKLAGKSIQEVSAELGSPVSCSTTKYGPKCIWEHAGTEIVFIDNKADWFTINAVADLEYTAMNLKLLGFNVTSPDISTNFAKRWDYEQGAVAIALFPNSYAYIKFYTE